MKRGKKMKEKFIKILMTYVLPILIIGISVFLFLFSLNKNKKIDVYESTVAEIISITSDYDAATEAVNMRVFIKYTVNGREYTAEIDEYKPNYREGMKLDVKYDPQNPYDVLADDKSFGFMNFGIAALFFAVGAFLLVKNIRNEIISKREHEYDA